MPNTMKDFGIGQLNPQERALLALDIWESLGDDRPRSKLTAEQKAELARRDGELNANPAITLIWQQIRASMEAKP